MKLMLSRRARPHTRRGYAGLGVLALVGILSLSLVFSSFLAPRTARAASVGTWSPAGSMSVGRWAATATLLPNGEVLVAGGQGSANGPEFSSELFSPVTPTSTALTSSAHPAPVGQAVSLTATVSPTPDGGTVTFSNGPTSLYSAVALSAGVATCSTIFAKVGQYSIVDRYSGTPAYTSSALSSSWATIAHPAAEAMRVRAEKIGPGC